MFLQCLLIWITVKSQLFPQAFDNEWFILGVLVEMMEYTTACFFERKPARPINAV